MPRKQLFTSESVTEGHPDKIADQISDAVLDAILSRDPQGRVACETVLTTGLVMLVGEITTSCFVDLQRIARTVLAEIGYTDAATGFDSETCSVITAIHEQSADIALGVDRALEARKEDLEPGVGELGAGDQGLMFGYAVKETDAYMPLPIALAHQLARRLAFVRKQEVIGYLRPDGKTQVTVEYRNGRPARIDAVVVSTQHDPGVDHGRIERDIISTVIREVVPERLLDDKTVFFINPTGRFVIGGPHGDSGLTGRKIIVDTYGGVGRHGGGAFSGKDPTKVDRSASYAARWVAKNLVAAGVADRCEVQIAYAIGVAKPVSVSVNTHHTHKIPEEQIIGIINNVFDLRPGAIIRDLGLRQPLYRQVAAYGHFGRDDLDLPWERLDRVEAIQRRMASTSA
jgi:S-adenosylmethionine synthetase